MKIIKTDSEYIKVEEQYTTIVKLDDGTDLRMASYVYNNKLAPEETGCCYIHSDIYDKLSEEQQEEIIKKVNEYVEKWIA
jgi:hypothetical protein